MREIYGFLRLANPFGHLSQVRTQVLVLPTCVDLRVCLARALVSFVAYFLYNNLLTKETLMCDVTTQNMQEHRLHEKPTDFEISNPRVYIRFVATTEWTYLRSPPLAAPFLCHLWWLPTQLSAGSLEAQDIFAIDNHTDCRTDPTVLFRCFHTRDTP